MKKYIKVVCVLLSLLLIFTAISCANDSVETSEPNTNTEKPSNKPNKEEVNYDGTYPIELKLIPTKIITGDFSKVDLSKLQYLDDSLKLERANNCTMKTDGVEKKYNFYQFDIPEKLKGYFTGDPKSEIPIDGIVIATKALPNNQIINLTISDKGQTITTDCKDAVYFGTISDVNFRVLKYNLDFKSISLKDKNNKEYLYLSEPDKYVGTWKHEKGNEVLTIIINSDATGSYNFSETDKGPITLDYTKIGSIEVKKNDNTIFGKLIASNKVSLDFYPTGKFVPIPFTKNIINENTKIPEIK